MMPPSARHKEAPSRGVRERQRIEVADHCGKRELGVVWWVCRQCVWWGCGQCGRCGGGGGAGGVGRVVCGWCVALRLFMTCLLMSADASYADVDAAPDLFCFTMPIFAD